MSISTKIKDYLKVYLRKTWEFGQKLGFDILPNHYYSNLPNIRDLKKDGTWKKPYSMLGIQGTDITRQTSFVRKCCESKFLQEQMRSANIHSKAVEANHKEGFGPIEADFLFCFIFTKKPKKIIQIGCGLSTAVILQACSAAKYKPKLICIDPYPNKYLKKLSEGHEISLLGEKAQNIPLNKLISLKKGDLLFIDSTHMVKPGSEVGRLITEVLPRLPTGVCVHFHDITFPYDYPRHILTRDLFFPNETIMLYAFLVNNPGFTIKASLSMLHYGDKSKLKKLLPNYKQATDEFGLEKTKGHYPSSIYIEAV
jgi:predicted O-methyltransferase YrrM